ncbi:Delta(1)-pyrroline-2-carboxylate reductase [Neobacillus rhizosphaerae]|uniref:Delta(1)-pyrroline-2-carboxylate reductase n=1 Tax=Neobacillus rhizosphaerae TaxID=2880965 RepID=A0ABN8KTT3_9BACI|nr:ornithine cyclodeaminase family protein [Neobacillus rhizosphaerae]CAH2715885.1 Delta(1)-pyrroline-2-carboxylate reductase [Neobacillus rhizosphaerae]
MFDIRILSKEDVTKIITMQQVIEVVESVYKAKSESLTDVWPTVFYEFNRGKADLDIKSGYLKSKQLFGHKTVTWFGDNAEKGIPTLIGMIAVFDAETGMPLGMTDAAYITGMRTGAAGALGAKYLAREDAENLLIVGAGNQAIFQIAATLTTMPTIKKVRVAAQQLANAKSFVEGIHYKLQHQFGISIDNITFEAVEDLEKAVHDSHIIITITPSRKPIIKKEWLKIGTHISCIGADMVGKQEIDAEILTSSLLFVDDTKHCKEVGEIEIPLKQGVINETNIIGELGDLIVGKVKGRTSNEQITVFDATGMALLDIATADMALKQAEKNELGTKTNI